MPVNVRLKAGSASKGYGAFVALHHRMFFSMGPQSVTAAERHGTYVGEKKNMHYGLATMSELCVKRKAVLSGLELD